MLYTPILFNSKINVFSFVFFAVTSNEKQASLPMNLKAQFANLVSSGSQVTPQAALLQTMVAMHQKVRSL